MARSVPSVLRLVLQDQLMRGAMDQPQARSLKGKKGSSDSRTRVRWDTGCRLSCLLTTLHPERALSRALVQHLSHEMPDIDFTLENRPGLHAVWVCGYEPGAAELVRRLRDSHPRSFLVVTGRGPLEVWQREVLDAGADFASGWPIPYDQLSRILHRRRVGPIL